VTTIAVVYHSQGGHTQILAEAVAEGAASFENTSVALHRIDGKSIVDGRFEDEELLTSLDEADAIVFGSPTHMGSVSGPFKSFLDATLHRWQSRRWSNKVAAAFTVSSTPSGDKLTGLLASYVCAMQHGMIWVGVDQSPINADGLNRLGFYVGVGAQADYTGASPAIDEGDRRTGIDLGVRVATITAALRAGTPA
jgi:NAD(P)H dehydrogenase (quinone)